MQNECGNCKANPVDIARNTRGTPTAKLIAILIAQGITDNKLLAEITGLKVRAIQCARNAIQCAQPAAHADTSATECAQQNAQAQYNAPKTQPAAPSRAESNNNITNTKPNITTVGVCVVDARSRGSRLEADWVLPQSWGEWAQINTQLDRQAILAEADKFRDFWISQPGAKGRKADWQATWRNWCRNAKTNRPYSPAQMAHDERKARLVAEGKPTTLREALNRRIAEEAAKGAAA